MKKNQACIMRAIGSGIATGMFLGLMGSQLFNNKKQLKKKAGNAMHAMGDLLDNVQYMFK